MSISQGYAMVKLPIVELIPLLLFSPRSIFDKIKNTTKQFWL